MLPDGRGPAIGVVGADPDDAPVDPALRLGEHDGRAPSWSGIAVPPDVGAPAAVTSLPRDRRRLLAGGTVFTIDSRLFLPDADAGDGTCGAILPVTQGGDGSRMVCTLRAAITESNTNTGEYTFRFAIGDGPVVLAPGFFAPMASTVHIDATTQPGYAGLPLIRMDGPGTPDVANHALWLQGAGSSVAGLSITNYQTGILVHASDVTIVDNHIGTDSTGTADSSGNVYGIRILGGDRSRIGMVGHRNVIGANSNCGLLVQQGTTDTTVQANWFGVGADGLTRLPQGNAIRIVDATRALVGGEEPDQGNVISGASITPEGVHPDAVSVHDSPQTHILNNNVGLDPTGEHAITNVGTGIAVLSSPRTSISNNLVSGNLLDGILVSGETGGDLVVGDNLIGSNLDGSGVLGNGNDGIILTAVSAHGEWEATEAPDAVRVEGNEIVGSGAHGLLLSKGSDRNKVLDNDIGISEDHAPGNAEVGIYVWENEDNVIGEPDGTGVLMGGNRVDANRMGVLVYGAKRTTIQNNLIGTVVPNLAHGIALNAGASETVIGYPRNASITPGACEQRCNRILGGSRGEGVSIQGGTTTGTTVRGNEIVSAESPAGVHMLTIGLGNDLRQTPNDGPRDADTGANGLLNFPVGVVPTYVPASKQTYVHGSLAVAAGTEPLLVDVYRSETASTSGYGRGEKWIGSLTVTPKQSADNGTHFEFALPDEGDLTHYFYSATVTDATGSTSEMSATCRDTDEDGFGDGDGDGLCDDWETKNTGTTSWGLDYDGDGQIEYALGDAPYRATPDRRDLFVEVDSMAAGDGYPAARPTPAGMAHMAKAFAAGPGGGVRVHVNPEAETDPSEFFDAADSQPTTTVRPRPGPKNDIFDAKNGEDSLDRPCDGSFGTLRDHKQGTACASRLAARRLVFRYVLWTHRLDAQDPNDLRAPAGLAPGVPSADAAVSMLTRQEAIDGAGGLSLCKSVSRCRDVADSWTLMHELGHTLGLDHGGDEKTNDKVNYLSLMNYRYSYPDGSRLQDFSRWTLPPLDLRSLDEATGILDGHHAGEYPGLEDWGYATYSARVIENPEDPGTALCAGTFFSAPGEPIDWNGDFDTEDTGREANPARRGEKDPIDWCLKPAANPKSTSFNDWAALRFGTRNVDPLSESETYPLDADRTPDLPVLMARAMDQDRDGVNDAEDVCRTTPDPDQADEDADGIGDACVGDIDDRDVSVEVTVEDRTDPRTPSRVSVRVANDFPVPVTGLEVAVRLPELVEPRDVATSTGSYDAASSVWTVPSLAKRSSATLELSMSPEEAAELVAELMAADQPDPDSVPGNGGQGGAVLEDDWASVEVPATQAPPGPGYVFEMAPHNGVQNGAGDLAWTEPVPGGGRRALVSIGGDEHEVMSVPSGRRLELGIADGGQVFVHDIHGDGQTLAPWYVWDGGTLSLLPDGFLPADANAAGLVVGRQDDQAATWKDGEVTMLPDLAEGEYGGSGARAVNDDGLVVGSATRPNPDAGQEGWKSETFAVMWRDGELVRTVPHQRPHMTGAVLSDVNQAGVAVGYERGEQVETSRVLRATEADARLLAINGDAAGIAESGDLVGDRLGKGPFLRHGDGTYLLADLAAAESPLRMSSSWAVGNDGILSGFGTIAPSEPGFYPGRQLVGRPEPAVRRAVLTPTVDYVDLGSTEVRAPSLTREVRVYNVGSAPVEFAPTVSGDAAPEVAIGHRGGDRVLQPGQFWTVQLTMAPWHVGRRTAWVEFPAPGGGARILVESTGTPAPGEDPTQGPTEGPTGSPTAEPTTAPTTGPTTGPTELPQPTFTQVRKPRISGIARVGRRLVVTAGTWTPAPSSVSYRWYRDGKAVKKAVRRTYALRPSDRGHRISVRVTVTRPGYTTATGTTASVRVRK